MSNEPDLTAVWTSVAADLPEGWTLHSLRCQPPGPLTLPQTPVWVAIATGPAGAIREAGAHKPGAALRRLVGQFGRDGEL